MVVVVVVTCDDCVTSVCLIFEDELLWMMKRILMWRRRRYPRQKIVKRSHLSLESSYLKNLLQRKMDQKANIPQLRMCMFPVAEGVLQCTQFWARDSMD